MEKVTNEELLGALKTIKVACEEVSVEKDIPCSSCPLGRYPGGKCMINALEPRSWTVNVTDNWKALL